MNPGAIFFDRDFAFHDGTTGEKLFVVLGTLNDISVVAKTTSRQHGRGVSYGCQPNDRFHNYHLPPGSCYLKTSTWVCLDEFYELNAKIMLQKRFGGVVNHICDLEPKLIRGIQDCSLISLDISSAQEGIIKACLI